MKRKRNFLIWSIVFAVLAIVCFAYGLWSCNSIMELQKDLSALILGAFFTTFSYCMLVLTVVFAVLGGVFSLLAMKKQELKAICVTAFEAVCFILGLIAWITILDWDKGFSGMFAGMYIGAFAAIFTFMTIGFGIFGGVISVRSLIKQGAKAVFIGTIAVSSVLVTVSSVFLIVRLYLSY